MAKSQNLKEKHIVGALREAHGNILVASQRLGCTRANLYYHIKRNVRLQELQDELLQEEIDLHEDVLRDLAINDKHCTALLAFLNAKAKDRGYARHNVDMRHSGGVDLRVLTRADLEAMSPTDRAQAYRDAIAGEAKVVAIEERKRAG